MGSAVAIALTCKTTIAFANSEVSINECRVGLVPDAVTIYFLSRGLSSPLSNEKLEGLGLYLALTGRSVYGADVYLCGLATHYIQSNDSIAKVIENIKKNCTIERILESIGITPSMTQESILNDIEEIREIFGNARSIQQIYEKLTEKNTTFSRQVWFEMSSVCPLSLKLTVKAFLKCSRMEVKECIELAYKLSLEMMLNRSINFSIAMNMKHIQKSKGNINWQPEKLADVSTQLVNEFFQGVSDPPLELELI